MRYLKDFTREKQSPKAVKNLHGLGLLSTGLPLVVFQRNPVVTRRKRRIQKKEPGEEAWGEIQKAVWATVTRKFFSTLVEF